MLTSWPPPGIAPVDYAPQITSREAIQKRFELVRQVLAEATSEAMRSLPGWELAEATFSTGAPVESYARNVPLVARFIGAEFDTTTLGVRGLGRHSPMPPRLGGRYGSKVCLPLVQRDLGLAAEEVFLAGFGTALYVLHFMKTGAARLIERNAETVWELWVPRAYAGLRGVNLLDVGTEPSRAQFLETARKHRLAGRLRPAKRMHLGLIGRFYASAGAALCEVNTDVLERERAGST